MVNTTLANTSAVLALFDDMSESEFRICNRRRGVLAIIDKHQSNQCLQDGFHDVTTRKKFLPPDLLEEVMSNSNSTLLKLTWQVWHVLSMQGKFEILYLVL